MLLLVVLEGFSIICQWRFKIEVQRKNNWLHLSFPLRVVTPYKWIHLLQTHQLHCIKLEDANIKFIQSPAQYNKEPWFDFDHQPVVYCYNALRRDWHARCSKPYVTCRTTGQPPVKSGLKRLLSKSVPSVVCRSVVHSALWTENLCFWACKTTFFEVSSKCHLLSPECFII